MSNGQQTGRELLKQTLRSVASGRSGNATATERMRAALSLAHLQGEVTSPEVAALNMFINGSSK